MLECGACEDEPGRGGPGFHLLHRAPQLTLPTVPSASLFPGDGPRSKTLLSACETQRLITGICLVAFSQVRLVKGTRNWNLACGGTRD